MRNHASSTFHIKPILGSTKSIMSHNKYSYTDLQIYRFTDKQNYRITDMLDGGQIYRIVIPVKAVRR